MQEAFFGGTGFQPVLSDDEVRIPGQSSISDSRRRPSIRRRRLGSHRAAQSGCLAGENAIIGFGPGFR
jgi:hypothetical protein